MENNLNPFGGNGRTQLSIPNVSSEIEGQRATQEVQASVLMARRFPRDEMRATDRILQACARPMLAENASYAFKRGKMLVTGPSIHLARVIAGTWGNIQYGIREISQEDGISTVEAFAWDLETNTRASRLFKVRHTRFSNDRGFTDLKDPRDIYELTANYGARRLRACILELIPDDVIEAAQKQCDITLKQRAIAGPEQIEKMIEAFKEFGVSREMLDRRLGCTIEKATAAQIVPLKRVYASLRDGMGKIEDFFTAPERVEINGKREALKNESKPKVQQRKANGANQPPKDISTPDEPQQASNPELVNVILKALETAKDQEEIAEAEDLIRELKNPGDKKQCEKALEAARQPSNANGIFG